MSSSKVLLITGATGIIGRRLVRHFLGNSLTVIALARRQVALDALGREANGLPGTLVSVEVDLLNRDPHDVVVDLARRGALPHYVVNCARDTANLSTSPDGWPTRQQWMSELELCVVVPAALTVGLASIADTRLESVVNIASIYGMVAVNPNLYGNSANTSPLHYGVAKAALLHMTKEMAVRLARQNIRVNAVSYGGVEGCASDAFKARYGSFSPMKRMLAIDEVPGAVDFLLSPAAGATTGHNLVADGGWTLW